MENEYSNTFRRLDKIKATIEALRATNVALRSRLARRDEALVAKVQRQAADINSLMQQMAAQERVLKSISKDYEDLKTKQNSCIMNTPQEKDIL